MIKHFSVAEYSILFTFAKLSSNVMRLTLGPAPQCSHSRLCITKQMAEWYFHKKAPSYSLDTTRDTHNGDREELSSIFGTIGARESTSPQPQVKLRLLRITNYGFLSELLLQVCAGFTPFL
jgi:hypothetical protein